MVFVYGGCEGNANNFYTKPACKIVCMQHNRSKDILIFIVVIISVGITIMQNLLLCSFLQQKSEGNT